MSRRVYGREAAGKWWERVRGPKWEAVMGDERRKRGLGIEGLWGNKPRIVGLKS